MAENIYQRMEREEKERKDKALEALKGRHDALVQIYQHGNHLGYVPITYAYGQPSGTSQYPAFTQITFSSNQTGIDDVSIGFEACIRRSDFAEYAERNFNVVQQYLVGGMILLDIAGFTSKTSDEQILLMAGLRDALKGFRQNSSKKDYTFTPTGDGFLILIDDPDGKYKALEFGKALADSLDSYNHTPRKQPIDYRIVLSFGGWHNVDLFDKNCIQYEEDVSDAFRIMDLIPKTTARNTYATETLRNAVNRADRTKELDKIYGQLLILKDEKGKSQRCFQIDFRHWPEEKSR